MKFKSFENKRDLAYQLRKKLGDWFKALHLLKSSSATTAASVAAVKQPALGDSIDQHALENDMVLALSNDATDAQLEETYSELGDYYAERQRWDIAVKYYTVGRNLDKQADCYYILEDYANLSKIIDQLPDNSEFLVV